MKTGAEHFIGFLGGLMLRATVPYKKYLLQKIISIARVSQGQGNQGW